MACSGGGWEGGVRTVGGISGGQEDGKWPPRLQAPSYPIPTSLKAHKLKNGSELQGSFCHWAGSPFGAQIVAGRTGPGLPELVCAHCAIINAFPPLRAAPQPTTRDRLQPATSTTRDPHHPRPPPPSATKLVEINRGTGKTEPWRPSV